MAGRILRCGRQIVSYGQVPYDASTNQIAADVAYKEVAAKGQGESAGGRLL